MRSCGAKEKKKATWPGEQWVTREHRRESIPLGFGFRFLCSSSRKSGRRKTRKHFISARRTPGLTSGWILLNALLDEGSKTNLHSYFPHKVKAYETIPARSIDKETLGWTRTLNLPRGWGRGRSKIGKISFADTRRAASATCRTRQSFRSATRPMRVERKPWHQTGWLKSDFLKVCVVGKAIWSNREPSILATRYEYTLSQSFHLGEINYHKTYGYI